MCTWSGYGEFAACNEWKCWQIARRREMESFLRILGWNWINCFCFCNLNRFFGRLILNAMLSVQNGHCLPGWRIINRREWMGCRTNASISLPLFDLTIPRRQVGDFVSFASCKLLEIKTNCSARTFFCPPFRILKTVLPLLSSFVGWRIAKRIRDLNYFA